MIANPRILTKELRLQHNAATGERWLRCSSNFLRGFGFEPGTRIARQVIGGGQAGLRITTAMDGDASVYERGYRGTNARREAQLDVKVQPLINAAFPGWCERVHFTFKHGEVVAVPVANRTFHIRKSIKGHRGPVHAFLGMSSGVDGRCMSDVGFHVSGLLEWRPQEARDSQDLTETGVLTAMANLPHLDVVFNEDVMRVDWQRVADTMKGRAPVGCLHLSLQCDDFSTMKSNALRQRSIENLTTSADMVYDALRMVEVLQPATVVVEQVRGFSEKLGFLMEVKLRRWGYNVQSGIFSAPDFGGRSGRTRYYLVASVFPGYAFPSPTQRRTAPIWPEIADQIPECTDVSATKTVAAARTSPRGFTTLTPATVIAPTLIKSQSHAPKDALYLEPGDGRTLFPNVEIMRRLNGIPADFNLGEVSKAIAMEQVGQSIEYPMHHAIMQSLHDHIRVNLANEPVTAASLVLSQPEFGF